MVVVCRPGHKYISDSPDLSTVSLSVDTVKLSEIIPDSFIRRLTEYMNHGYYIDYIIIGDNSVN